jgi:hypothetical protein
MITPGYALTATERVLPRLALDFTTANLDSRVTVTRALNTATRVNSSGYVEVVNADLPRFDFDPLGSGLCKGLLIEESRTNFLAYGNDFRNASWSLANTTVSNTAVTGPDNTLSAYALTEDTATNNHAIFQQFATLAAGAYTYSIFIKPNGRTQFRLAQTVGATYSVDYDLNTMTAVGTDGGATGSIQSFRNGWYRCFMTFTTVASINQAFVLYLMSNGQTNYTGNGTSGVIPWGGQVEAGAFATSYIPTTTTSLTRNADAVAMTGTNFSDWYNASEGALSFEGSILADQGATTVDFSQISNGVSNSNVISLCMFGATAPLFQVVNGTTQANIDLGTLAVGSVFKMTGAYKLDSFAGAINGDAAVTDVSGSIPTGMTQIGLGNRLGGGYMNGHARRFMYWPQRLTNAEVQAFSK